MGFALAVLIYYLISVIGLPDMAEPYAGRITGLLWRVIGITVVVELVLDGLASLGTAGVTEDERDRQIEGKGFRNAYYFLTLTLVVLIANVLVSDFMSEASGEAMMFAMPFVTLHALVCIVLSAVFIKASTQVYFYRQAS